MRQSKGPCKVIEIPKYTPENSHVLKWGPFQKEPSRPTSIFQGISGDMLVFRGSISLAYNWGN